MKNIKTTIALISLVVLLNSCAIFKGSVEIDMQTFSDNTTVLFNEAIKVSRPFQFKTLAIYTDINEYENIKVKSKPLVYALKGIVYYSNQLVAISNSSMSEKGKNKQLAIYLEEVLKKAQHQQRMDSIGLSHSQVELTLNEIKTAESYREGIEAADPIIKTIVLAMFDRLNEVEGLIDEVIVAFDQQIYNDYESAIHNYLALKELQNSTQRKITDLYFAQTGEIALIDSVLNADLSVAPFFTNMESVKQSDYDAAEEFLFARLEKVDIMLRQLDDDKEDYMNMKEEIRKWHSQVDENISIARNSLIVWSQSHKNLGVGIEIPPLIGVETFIELIGPAVSDAANTLL